MNPFSRLASGLVTNVIVVGTLLWVASWPASAPPVRQRVRVVSLAAPPRLTDPPLVAPKLPRTVAAAVPQRKFTLPASPAPSPGPVVATNEPPPAPKSTIAAPVAPPPPPPAPLPAPKPVVGMFESTVAQQRPTPRREPVVETAGFGASASPNRDARPTRSLNESGFGAIAEPRSTRSAPGQTQLVAAQFEAQNLPAVRQRPAATITTPVAEFEPVQILSKPRPQYTEQARRLTIEGEVLVKVLFGADKRVRVLNVVRGLGHGLDENAAVAAAQIQFEPARRNGVPVEQAAVVRVQFQLAQ
jgi:TonB family protein